MFRDTVLLLGYSAAVIGAVTYFPQLYRIIKTKHTKDLSLSSYVILDIVTMMWFVYALLNKDIPLMVNTSLVFTCSFAITLLKLKHG